MTYTKKIERWRNVADKNPRGFVESKLRIANLSGQEVPFRYKWAQKQYSEIKQYLHKQGIPVRLWMLKWRRAGLSSAATAESYATAWGRDNARIGIIAHQEERAKELLNNYKAYNRSLNTWHPELELEMSKDNVYGIKFERSNAQVLIATAQNAIKIRGDGIHILDGSEAAHWFDRFRQVTKEVCPVVPPKPGSQICYESTGSLLGSAPYIHYTESVPFEEFLKGKRGKNEFIRKFLCWLDDPSEVVDLPPAQMHELMELIHYSEPRLSDMNAHYKLTPGQIARAWEMYNLQADNDFDYFCREFPYSEAMAWTSGSNSYFGSYELDKAKIEDPTHVYVFEGHDIGRVFERLDDLRRIPQVDPYGVKPHVKIWKPPIPGRRYVIGSDSGLGDFDGDPSAGYIRELGTREMMGAYHGLMRPDEAAHINVSLARIYNNAMLAPETNPGGGGAEALNVIQRLNYHNIYVWRIRDGQKGLQFSQKIGWYTHSRSRPLMLGEERKLFLDCVNERLKLEGTFKDAALIQEMRTFGTDPSTGIPRANPNCFDDRVMADAITNQVCADEEYCTGKDVIHQYHKLDHLKKAPISQEEMLTKRTDPAKVLNDIFGKKSAFMNNKWEI